jgi:signal transduction histidine kinase
VAWYAPDSFRAHVFVIGVASLSMAVLAVILVQDAWRSTRRTLAQEAQQQCASAVRELQAQFIDRASYLAASAETLPLQFEAQDLSLRGLSAAVLRSYDGVEGGFLLGPQKRLAGHVGPIRRASIMDFDQSESAFIRSLAESSVTATEPVVAEIGTGTDVLVAAAASIQPDNGVAWALKRLPEANDPGAQRRRWWLAALVLSAVLGLGAIITTSIRLRQGVDTLNQGLAQLESDFNYRLPPVGGDFGRVAESVNRMSDRRAALEAHLRQQDRLAALGRVVAGVAHEIRNPLNSLVLTLELLARRVQRGAATGGEIRDVIEEVNRLEQILKRFLAFGGTKIESRTTQDLNPLLQRAIRVVTEQARRKKVEIVLSTEGKEPLQAELDDLAIEQILINLLLNAIDASPEGGVVTLNAAAEPDRIRISVRDRGPGIPDDAREHVFDPYFTTKDNGTGLGLAVSREIATQHGGSLQFVSTPDGSTFVLTLPAIRSEAGC